MKPIMQASAVLSIFIVTALLSRCGGGSKQSSPPLTITTASLPNGITGTAYNQTIQAAGGVGPFAWTISVGALPHNLALSASATNTVAISGTPDTGTQGVTFTVKVGDSAGQSATQAYTVSMLLGTDSLALAPTSFDFGMQLVGTASTVQTESLTNTGLPLAINSIGITGANTSDFNQVNTTCGSSLATAASCDVSLGFTPSQLGPRVAALTITDDNVGSPQSVSVNGTGVTSGPNATLSATSLTFGDETVSTTSPVQSINLNNYGTAALNVSTISTTTDFAETDDCLPSLPSGATCTINVTFTPSTAGSINGTISVTDNAPGSPQDVELSGTGSSGGRCVSKGGQCYQGHSCCPGLQCVPASTRAFCE
jgi:hypothetical protein